MDQDVTWLLFGMGILILYFLSTINIIKEYERAVMFRLDDWRPTRGPGLSGSYGPSTRWCA